ncbi:hypothetical protein DXG01_002738 [Tephrocybe rancida]|nr:hypothetical protein DXG01_002738 [Tephrocybe rancida]
MENLFKQAGISEDTARKEAVTEYVDAQTDREWRGFDTFENPHTWDAFLKEIYESYPDAASEAGSVAALEKICKEHARLGRSDSEELHSLMRQFRAESKKLDEVLGNGALVDKFVHCLTPAFAELVQDKLLTKYGHHSERKRHKDNKYDLSEVLKMVSSLIDDRSREDTRSYNLEKSPKVKQENDETEGKLANLQDSVTALNKEMSSLRSYMQTMTSELRTTSQFINSNRNTGSVRVDSSTPTLHSSQQAGSNCFHCWLAGHRVAQCEELQKQVKEGEVILVDNRPRLPNGDPIPREPSNICPRDRIKNLHNKKVSSFYGWVEEEDTKTYSIYTNATRDTRDDLLERVNTPHTKSDTDGKLDKLCDLVAGLINTRTTASTEEVRNNHAKGF